MKVKRIEHFEELRAYREEWNRLLEKSPTRTIFQTFEWLESWWNAFGDSCNLAVALVFDGDCLVAAAPLVGQDARAYGRRMQCLEFAGGMPSDYTDFLYRDEASFRRAVEAIRSEFPWDFLDLKQIPARSPTTTLLADQFPGWRGTLFIYDVSPAYVFGPDRDGSDILGKKSIRRHVRGLQKAGAVEVRHLTQAEIIEPELEDFFDQHVQRRAVTEAPSHFLDTRYRLFYRELTKRLAPKGWLLFTVVSLDGQAVAFHYGFVYERQLVWYKPSFSIELAHLSPGEVLIAELVKYCRAEELAELDFSVGDEAFKNRFSNVTRHTMRFRTFRSGVYQRLDWANRALRERGKRVKVVRQVHSMLHRPQGLAWPLRVQRTGQRLGSDLTV